jgi:hypothetical protein
MPRRTRSPLSRMSSARPGFSCSRSGSVARRGWTTTRWRRSSSRPATSSGASGSARTAEADAPLGALRVRSVDWRALWDHRVACVVEKLRRRIEPVRPDDRVRLSINPRPAEVLGIAERLAQRAAKQKRAIDVADGTVVEDHSETIGIERLHVCDAKHDLDFTATARPEPRARVPARASSCQRAREGATVPTDVRGAGRAVGASHRAPGAFPYRSVQRPHRTARGSAAARG